MKKFLQRTSFLFLFLILACSGSGDDEGQTNEYISLFVSSTEGFIGETIIFSVFDGEGNNVSSSTDFYVNETKIPSNTHTFNTIGTFDVYAKYGQLTSETKTIEIMPTPITFKQNVVVEDFTGTWCGWCPRVSEAVRLLKQETSDAIVVAIHNGDAMQFSQEGAIRQAFNVTGFPTALINRQERWASPQPSNVAQVTGKMSGKSYASIAMESTVSGDVLDLKVKVMMGYSYKSMKLAVYMLEDGLVYDQRNFTSYYGGADPIRDFVHDDVLRRSLTDVFGDDIPQDQVGHNKTFTRDFQYAIPPSYDKNKVKLVAFVTTGSERDIINVRQSKLGESQDFQPLN
jgi:thiol-disulfide isomerase/thioredoxin